MKLSWKKILVRTRVLMNNLQGKLNHTVLTNITPPKKKLIERKTRRNLDTSLEYVKPDSVGAGQFLKGWDVGIDGMRVGGKRRLTIPREMGFGAKGVPPEIPPNACLVYDLQLIKVTK